MMAGLISLAAIAGQAQNNFSIKGAYNSMTNKIQSELTVKQKVGPVILVHNSRYQSDHYMVRTGLLVPLAKLTEEDGSSLQLQAKSVTLSNNEPWTLTGFGGQIVYTDGNFSLSAAAQPLILTKQGRANFTLADASIAYKLPNGYSVNAMGILKSQAGDLTGLESKISVTKKLHIAKSLDVEIGVDGIYRVKNLDPSSTENLDVRGTLTMYLF